MLLLTFAYLRCCYLRRGRSVALGAGTTLTGTVSAFVPGYAVSLIKAGVTMEGVEAGPVRAPLIMPSPEDLAELTRIVAAGRAVIADQLAAVR